MDDDVARALRSARTALGWAIGAAVGAALALLMAVAVLVTTFAEDIPENDYYAESLRGQVTGLTPGGALTGDRLEEVLGGVLDEYEIEHSIQCPDTARVEASTVVVCAGSVDDYQWTGVVAFEDEDGRFAVVEL